jgi:Domain of unknown function (DUF4157)
VEPDVLAPHQERGERLHRPAIADTTSAAPGRSGHERLEQLASTVGNRAFGLTIARMHDGEGILPGGLVHPDVQAAIATAQGQGRSLPAHTATQAGEALGDSFEDVRVHDDAHAAALSRAVSARAFTVGRDIFFGAGEYSPASPGGRDLLTHELAHVVQQRGAPAAGPLHVSNPGDPLEREAESAARGI